jgi:hypothetical protein
MGEAIRKLELRQQCKKCTTKTVGRRTDSDWSYGNNEGKSKALSVYASCSFKTEYQRRIGNWRDENEDEKNDTNPNIAINFAFKPLSTTQPGVGLGNIPDTTESEDGEDGMKEYKDKSIEDYNGKGKEKYNENIEEKKGIAGNIADNFEVKLPTAPIPELHRAIAMHPFSSTLGQDCFFDKGDQIAIFHSIDADWWWGINLRTMAQGLLPKSYVLILNSSIPRVPVENLTFHPYENGVGEAMLDYINN